MYSENDWKRFFAAMSIAALMAACAPKGLNRSEAIELGDRAMEEGQPKRALATYRHGLQRYPGDAKLADREKSALAAVVTGMLEGLRDGSATAGARREFEGMLAAEFYGVRPDDELVEDVIDNLYPGVRRRARSSDPRKALASYLARKTLAALGRSGFGSPAEAKSAALRYHRAAIEQSMHPGLTDFHLHAIEALSGKRAAPPVASHHEQVARDSAFIVRIDSDGLDSSCQFAAQRLESLARQPEAADKYPQRTLTVHLGFTGCDSSARTRTAKVDKVIEEQVPDGTRIVEETVWEEVEYEMPIQTEKCIGTDSDGNCNSRTTVASSYTTTRSKPRTIRREVPKYKTVKRTIKVDQTIREARFEVGGQVTYEWGGQRESSDFSDSAVVQYGSGRKFGTGSSYSKSEAQSESVRRVVDEARRTIEQRLAEYQGRAARAHLLKAQAAGDEASRLGELWYAFRIDNGSEDAARAYRREFGLDAPGLRKILANELPSTAVRSTPTRLDLPNRLRSEAEREYDDPDPNLAMANFPLAPIAAYYRSGMSPLTNVDQYSAIGAWLTWGGDGLAHQGIFELGSDSFGGDGGGISLAYRGVTKFRDRGAIWGSLELASEFEVLPDDVKEGLDDDEIEAMRQRHSTFGIGAGVSYPFFSRLVVDGGALLNLSQLNGTGSAPGTQNFSVVKAGVTTHLLLGLFLRGEGAVYLGADDFATVNLWAGWRLQIDAD